MQSQISLADLNIDLTTGSILRDGEIIPMPELSRKVLLCLIELAPAAATPTQLASQAWDLQHVSDETIAQRIALIRKALGDDPKTPRYIRTLRGEGYAIACPIKQSQPAFDWASFQMPRFPGVWTGLAAATVVGGALLWSFSTQPPSRTTPSPSTARSDLTATALITSAQNHMRIPSAEGTERAISLLRQAMEIDPDNIGARIGLSFALSTRATKFAGPDSDPFEAEQLAAGVLDIDDENAPAWHARAYALDAQGKIDEALPAYQFAYTLDPTDFSAMSSAAYLMAIRGSFADALALEVRAKALASSNYADVQIATALDLLNYPTAEDWYQRARTLETGLMVVVKASAEAHLRRGEPQAALAAIDAMSVSERDAPRIQILIGRAAWTLNDPERALEAWNRAGEIGALHLAIVEAMSGAPNALETQVSHIQDMMREGDTWPEMRIGLAEALTVLGRQDAAMDALSQAIDLGWRDRGMLEHSPFLTSLRERPQYQSQLDRIDRALQSQRILIEGMPELAPIITGNG